MSYRCWGHIMHGLRVVVFLISPYVIAPVLAQDEGVQRKISLQYEDIVLADLFNIITRETGYSFFYNNQSVNDRIKVTVHEYNVPLAQVLEKLLQPRGYGWEVRAKRIGVFPEKGEAEKAEQRNERTIRGVVEMADGTPLEGATISMQEGGAKTNEKGAFFLRVAEPDSIIRISYTGFKTQEMSVRSAAPLRIVLEPAITDLAMVAVRSNGYQKIPAERATGSLVQLNNQLLNRRVGPTILERLEGVASGVLFPNKNIPPNSNEAYISIRGRSTILANAQPLIIVDHFPYTGDINLLNPNDVESVTILKDAAASSIWGAFSGNGVIVITTKKGKLHQPLKVELNTNVTIGSRPDLFYNPAFLGSNEFINVEQLLFDKGFYDADLSNDYSYPVISPVVELLNKKRSGSMSAAEVDAAINQLRKNDIRKDYEKYFYRNSVSQQYAVNISSGGNKSAYLWSVGYDRDLSNRVGNASSRFTINNNSIFQLWNRAEFSSGVSFALNKADIGMSMGSVIPGAGKSLYYPYAQLADADGNALPLPKDFRYSFISQLNGDGLLDWTYRPLDELKFNDNVERRYHLRLNPGLKINIIKGLDAEIRYQFEKQIGKQENYNSVKGYYARNLINLFTQVDASGGVTHPIPVGSIFEEANTELTSNNYRAQLNFNRTFNARHNVAAIAVIEQRETVEETAARSYYGYNKENLSFNNLIDYTRYYDAYLYLGTAGYISGAGMKRRFNNEFISYSGNAAYTLDRKYIISGSMRLDQSNIWGVTTNQKGVPLWSVGLGWHVDKESFYKSGWLPALKLRATYGYNGNIDRSISGRFVITYLNFNQAGLPVATIASYPNPRLRWERIGMFNFGVDFETKNKILGGSIEYYRRKGTDLMGEQPVAMQTGLSVVKGNFADMKGGGVDVSLTSYNINRRVSWVTDFLFSYNWDEITDYKYLKGIIGVVTGGDGTTSALFPVVGRPVYGVYSYKWAGLDPENGDPQGYVDGKVSKEYNTILNNNDGNSIVYNGPARPTIFGALRNTVSYRNFTLSVNLIYKMRYYFRRSSVMYNALFNRWSGGHKDFLSRWQQKGDELHTSVPSLTYPGDGNRDNFFQYSNVLVEKGDHIRLQDLRLSYSISSLLSGNSSIKDVQLYLYANNIGVVWKANKAGLDPDYVMGNPAPRTFSLGCNAKF